MKGVLLVLSGYLIFVGWFLAASPQQGKRLTNWWLKDKLHRPWALLPAGVGLLILWAVPASRAPIFIQTLGWLALIKAVVVLVTPKVYLLKLVKWWHQLPQFGYRLWGVGTLGFGLAVLVTL